MEELKKNFDKEFLYNAMAKGLINILIGINI